MVETSDEPSLLDRTRSSPGPAHASSKSFRVGTQRANLQNDTPLVNYVPIQNLKGDHAVPVSSGTASHDVPDNTSKTLPPPAPPPDESRQGAESSTLGSEEKEEKASLPLRIYTCLKTIVLSTWLNVLLVFVPIGIAVHNAPVDKTIVFAMNALAIVPLAGLLSYATETVAGELGDTIGALMNVTFGNAVELIIFIALTKNELRIVQASILGSILANLLLILGMCFLIGGLRFREQVYNSTVTQMSACLLSLSVMSLLLPTAFYASFHDRTQGKKATLDISRGTSVILLCVYVLYLLFQLKSHAYMYQSTPQHVIDEESHPGLLHDVFETSSSSDDSSSSSGSTSDASSGSNTTAKRIKRVLIRGRRRRKSSGTSTETPTVRSTVCNASLNTISTQEVNQTQRSQNTLAVYDYGSGEEADDDKPNRTLRSNTTRDSTVNSRDFENEKANSIQDSQSPDVNRKKSKKKHHHRKNGISDDKLLENPIIEEKTPTVDPTPPQSYQEKPRAVGFQDETQQISEGSPKRPFNLRGLSVRDALPAMPAMPKLISNTVFSTTNPPPGPMAVTGVTPRALHRSHSLPSRLNQTTRVANQRAQAGPAMQPQPYLTPVNSTAIDSDVAKEKEKRISRTAAIFLLIGSTALVALCAEYLVDSIDHFVENTSVSQAFVGLIILPIVGNAAEHVCAVTVASKNKMDLAIGVAVGSSIQIALFVTPVIVLLGWMLGKDMTLYFSLFETISLFVSAFIVNFLVLDGRSNYLEGSLLIAAYIIIALAAFFYPDEGEASQISGDNDDNPARMLLRML